MAITVKHLKVSTVPDAGDDTLVEPSDWNADHTLTGTVPVANGGTGAATLTGYVKGNGTANMTAAATIPSTDITGLGTMSTQNSNNISVTGGSISGTTVSGYIPTTEKAAALGVATLDAGGTVPLSQIPASIQGGVSYQGTWNASTNTPTLTNGVGTKGYYYVVSVAGNTNLDGITSWNVGDWAIFNGTVWQKVDNTDAVTSVNGYTGTVVLTTTDVAEGTNQYFTIARARTSVSAGTGISYDNATGVITNSSPSLGGDVVGPASATDNAVARYDATTGKLLQNSLVIIGDTGSVTGVNALTAESLTVNNNATLGSSNTDTLDVNARITTDLDPNVNNAKDIGTSGRNWRDGFFGRTLSTVNLELTGTTSFDGSQGTAGQVLTSAGTGATPTWTTPTTGTVTSVTGTAPVVSSGGNTPAISMAAATGSVNGYLTSTDWTTFNGKANAFTYTSNYIPYGQGTTTPTQSVGLQYNGTTFTTTGISTSNNLTFTGTGNRITGDFNNATIASRVAFQNSVTNASTSVMVLPNGTSNISQIIAVGSSDPTNASHIRMDLRGDTSTAEISSSRYGTGTFLPLAFITSGAERLRITTAGLVGIGTSSPSGRLQLTGTVATGRPAVYLENTTASTGRTWFLGANDGGPFAINDVTAGSERMRIDSSGNVGIGTSSPSKKLEVYATSNNLQILSVVRNDQAGSGVAAIGFNTSSTAASETTSTKAGIGLQRGAAFGGGPLCFYNNNSGAAGDFTTSDEKMRIASDGIITMSAYGAGAATFSAAGVISSVSDETWKTKDGVPVNPEAMLQKLKAGYWFYNKEKAPIFGSDRQLGFYAQNVHEAIGEEAAPTPEEGKPWGYYDRSVLAITVMSLQNALNSIQELKTELDSVKAELQTLKGS